MVIINKLMEFIISIMDSLLPTLNLPEEFVTALDNGITVVIDLLEGANYFLPLDILVLCFSAMLIADNFTLLIRLGQWVIELVRG